MIEAFIKSIINQHTISGLYFVGSCLDGFEGGVETEAVVGVIAGGFDVV
jgi:hypothetical protein